MELTLLDDDEQATLVAALALVDGEYGRTHALLTQEVCTARACEQQGHTGPPARVVPDPWAQRGKRDRKRQRKEIERLRDEVMDLELQRAKQRIQDLSSALVKIFQQQLSKETLEYLTGLEKQRVQQQGEDKLTSSLSETLSQLVKIRAEMHKVLPQINTRNTRSVFSTSHSERDPERGPSHEFNTNTPVSCNGRQLEQFLWRQIATSVGMDCRMPSYHSLEVPRVKIEFSNCHQRHLSVGFSKSIEGRTIDGVFTIRKFIESDRVVFALASEIRF